MKAFPQSPMVDITTLITDGKHGDCVDSRDSGYYFLSSKDLRDGRLHYDEPRQITYEGFIETHRRTNLEPGDILLANCGASIGRVGMAQNDPRIDHTTFQKSISVIKANKSIVDNRYLYYFLLCNSGLLVRLGDGTAQPNLLIGNLKRISVSVPPRLIQLKIAGILSAYDDLIENNTRRIAILEEMAQAIYREWFINFCFRAGENAHRIDSAKPDEIPAGWKTINLFDVAEVTYGYPFKSKLFTPTPIGKPIVRIRDILRHKSETYTPETVSTKYIINNGDILIGMDGEFHMCRWAGGEALLNQRVVRLQTKGQLPQYILYHSIKGQINHFNATIVGTTVAHLGDKHLREIHVVLPPQELQSEVHTTFDPFFREEINLRKKNELLRSTRDLLLTKLISGQLDVEKLDIEIGEPLVELKV